jgi:PH/SEC7 domain-containing protein
MTCAEFCQNLSELNEGENFPRELLKNIYAAIKDKPIPWVAEELAAVSAQAPIAPESQQSHPHLPSQQPHARSSATPTTTNQNPPSASITLSRSGTGGINPFLQLPDPSQAVDYKNGYVMRKCCLDADGKRTKFGKRSWQMFFVALRDMVLFCFKDEKQARVNGAMQDPRLAIRIHHGLAVRATDYNKRQFVFRLHTVDQAQYLFQVERPSSARQQT